MIKRYFVGPLYCNNTRNLYITDEYGIVLDVLVEYIIGSPDSISNALLYYYCIRSFEFIISSNINNKGWPLIETSKEEIDMHINYNTLENNVS